MIILPRLLYALYELLLVAFPKQYRDECRDEMVETLRARGGHSSTWRVLSVGAVLGKRGSRRAPIRDADAHGSKANVPSSEPDKAVSTRRR
jgi:hypothetical protein